MYYVTAKEMQQDLEECYGQTSAAQIYSLHTELFEVAQEAYMSISEYFTKIKSVWDKLDVLDPVLIYSCQGCTFSLTKKVLKSQQNQRLIRFLMKLAEPFNQVRSIILMMEDLFNPSLAYRLLLQEEKHHNMGKLTGMHTDPVALTVDKSPYDRGTRLTWHGNFHKGSTPYKNHPMSGTKGTNTYYCDHCHLKGHTVDP